MDSRATWQDWIAAHPGAVSLAALAAPAAILAISAVEMSPLPLSSHFSTGIKSFLTYMDSFFIAASRSGNFSRLKSAYGTITYSACPPTHPPMST